VVTVNGFRVMDRIAAWLARAVIGLLYVPIVAVVVLSFNGSALTYRWGGFSLHWYGVLLHDAQIHQALKVSAEVGVCAATLATLAGLGAAMAISRFVSRGRGPILAALLSPLMIPEIVLGVSMLTVLSALHVGLSMWTLVLGHLVITLPYASLILLGAYQTLDESLEEAAADLGCNPWLTFRKVTFPLLRSSLLASWLLCFTISFGDIVMSTFTSGVGSTTLPLLVYSLLKSGLTPEINALGTLLVCFTFLIIFAVGLRQMRRALTSTGSQS
jgi:putrescine transport system permease protein